MTFPKLASLLEPVPEDQFFSEYWEKRPLFIERNNETFFQDIFSINDIDEYLARGDIRYPHVRLVQNGRELPLTDYAGEFTYGTNVFQGHIDTSRAFDLYNQGATFSFQLLQQSVGKLAAFSNLVERELQFPTQTNLFLTPPKSQGFTAHYDTHSFFVLHLYGEKRWRLYDNPVELPLLKERIFDDEVWQPRDPSMEILLKPGSLLYVPRGVYHEADTSGHTALQITMGIFPPLWVDLFHRAIDRIAVTNKRFREAPSECVGPTLNDPSLQGKFSDLCDLLSNEISINSVLTEIKDKTLDNQIRDSNGRLSDLIRYGSLNLNSKLTCRDVSVRLVDDCDCCILRFYDKRIKLPIALGNDLRQFLIPYKEFSVDEISSRLAPSSKIDLAKKLVEEGVLRVVTA